MARASTKQFSVSVSCVSVVTGTKGGIIDSGLTLALMIGHLEEISAISRWCFDLRANATSLAWSP